MTYHVETIYVIKCQYIIIIVAALLATPKVSFGELVTVGTLQKQAGCFNHRVVTLVTDKPERQWLPTSCLECGCHLIVYITDFIFLSL